MTENSELRYKLEQVPIGRIKPSGVNPRGRKLKERDPDRVQLEESVGERDILVPLVLTPIEDEKYDYMIVDGERRFYAAESLGLDSVPAHIIETDVDEASLVMTMFHIHANWQAWDAAQQCKAMESLFEKLVEEHGRDNIPELSRRVARLLKLKETTARDRVMFLLWPMEVKKKVYLGEHEGYWYVVEIEKSIMEPARKNFPEYFRVVDENEIRAFLFQKWEEGLVRRSTAPRKASVVARCVAAEGQKEKALEIFDRLWRDTETTYDDAYDDYVTVFPAAAREEQVGPRGLYNWIAQLSQTISEYDAATIVKGRRRSTVEVDDFVRAARELMANLSDLLDRLASRQT